LYPDAVSKAWQEERWRIHLQHLCWTRMKSGTGHTSEFSHPVRWCSLNNATDTQITVNSDAEGYAHVNWIMGKTAGTEKSSGNLVPVSRFTSDRLALCLSHHPGTGRAGCFAAGLRQQSGNFINAYLMNPLVVKGHDEFNNAVSGHPVSFQIIQGMEHSTALWSIN